MKRLALIFLVPWIAFAGVWDTVLQPVPTPKHFPISGYSEFTPPFQLGQRAYESIVDKNVANTFAGSEDGKDYFKIERFEEEEHLRPGLEFIAKHLLVDLKQLADGEVPGSAKLQGIPGHVTKQNPYYDKRFPNFKRHPLVAISPLLLSRTQQDLGRFHPWTIYGGGGFPKLSRDQVVQLAEKIYGVPRGGTARHLIQIDEKSQLTEDEIARAKFLYTLLPWSQWPTSLQNAYSARGNTENPLYLFPHPTSLALLHSPFYQKLSPQGPQLPMSLELSQFGAQLNALSLYGLKILTSSKRAKRFHSNHDLNHRKISEGNFFATNGDSAFQEIFEASPEVVGLYDKPLVRNTQIWGTRGPLMGRWILDGASATEREIQKAKELLLNDSGLSSVHTRTYYPPMEINGYQAFWNRPLVAWMKNGEVSADFEILGRLELIGENKSFSLPVHIELNDGTFSEQDELNALNLKKISEFAKYLDGELSPTLAWALVNPTDETDFQSWFASQKAGTKAQVAKQIGAPKKERPITFQKTVTNDFEIDYWKKLVELTEGPYRNGNNADCAATNENPHQSDIHCKVALPPQLDLASKGKFLKSYYENLGLPVFTHAFRWESFFDFKWWQGFSRPQENFIVVIHGTDGQPHDEAIILGDHYDTAYMGDVYESTELAGHRHASKGADDNHSGVVALMQAAEVLKDLPLKKDVWIVHITGEEFPADGLGSRALARALIENQPLTSRKNPRIAGVFVLDMIGHSTDRDHGRNEHIFQISPGRGTQSAKLAEKAEVSASLWNESVRTKNWDSSLKRKKPWKRFKTPEDLSYEKFPLPELGKLVSFRHEVRPSWHFRSSLYNTDPQIFTDVGFPVVLFMENYDIDRKGYHDTLDNLDNIDLDYARGVTSIVIETVARVALE